MNSQDMCFSNRRDVIMLIIRALSGRPRSNIRMGLSSGMSSWDDLGPSGCCFWRPPLRPLCIIRTPWWTSPELGKRTYIPLFDALPFLKKLVTLFPAAAKHLDTAHTRTSDTKWQDPPTCSSDCSWTQKPPLGSFGNLTTKSHGSSEPKSPQPNLSRERSASGACLIFNDVRLVPLVYISGATRPRKNLIQYQVFLGWPPNTPDS